MAFLSFTKGKNVTLDESAGLQNAALPVGSPAGDLDDNDTSLSLPTAFGNRLTSLGAGSVTKAALSGYDGSNTGLNAFTFSVAGYAGMSFTDSLGAPLNGSP